MDDHALLVEIAGKYGVSVGRKNEIYIPCPVHASDRQKDRNLHVFINNDGNIRYTCHSHNCDWQEIRKALLGDAPVAPVTSGRQRVKPSSSSNSDSFFVRGWTKYIQAIYTDQDGRHRPSYRMDYPVNYGQGLSSCPFIDRGEVCGDTEPHKHIIQKGRLDDIHIFLWVPEKQCALSKELGDPIVITEGEKAAKSIKDAGFTAASYIGGANNADKADYSQCQDRRVIIWPDDDTPGREAAQHVLAGIASKAIDVAIIETLGETGDDAADIKQEDIIQVLRNAEWKNPDFQPELFVQAKPSEMDELPLYLQSWPEKDTDLARLLHYRGDRFLTDGQEILWVSMPNGTYQQVSERGFTRAQQGFIQIWLEESRRLAADEVAQNVSEKAAAELEAKYKDEPYYVKSFIDMTVWKIPGITSAHERYNVKVVNSSDFNNRRVNPVIPFQSDNEHDSTMYAGLDLTTLRVVNADRVREMMVLAGVGWHVAPSMWNDGKDPEDNNYVRQMRKLLEIVWRNDRKADILAMLAQAILFPLPKIIIIKGASGIGKSVLFECFSTAFGQGLVRMYPDSQSLYRGRGEFTFFENTICQKMLVTYDEVDKDERPVPDRIIRDATAPFHEVVMKGMNPVDKNRTGMMVLMGNQYPLIDMEKEGATRRVWVCRLDYKEGMDETEYHRVIQKESLSYLFQQVARKAHELYLAWFDAHENDEIHDIPQDIEAYNEMLEMLMTPKGPQLTDWFELDDAVQSDVDLDNHGLWASEVLEASDTDWDTKQLHKEIKAFFKGVRSKRKTRDGEKEYKYALRVKEGTEDE